MGDQKRYQYTIDMSQLEPTGPPDNLVLRSIAVSDHHALATLMLDAYIGTTDYEDEGIDEALEEVGTFLDEDPSLDHSFVVVADEKLLSACLVTTWTDGNPFISYVMTDPNHKSGGLATACLLRSLESLLAAGETTVNAFITEGNTPSERLFARIGARRVG